MQRAIGKWLLFFNSPKKTSMRSGEANTLEWADADLERRIITLNRPEKGGNPRLLTISPELSIMLRALPKSDKKCDLLHVANF